MKSLILSLGLIFGVVFLASAQTVTPGVNQRQRNQTRRIEQGANSGQLTRGETRRLARQQRRIQVQKKVDKADGKVSPAERKQLNREQNRANRQIYYDKHNARKRP